jgi:RNA polymerase sigma factor (sigma-70 family)
MITVKQTCPNRSESASLAEPEQAAAGAVASPPAITRAPAPAGFEEFFRASYRELVWTAMIAGANREEAEDATAKTLAEMLPAWTVREHSLAYARRAVFHNFIKDKMRGTRRVARRLIDRGHVPLREGADDTQLTAWEDNEWVANVLSCLPPAQREVMECIARGLDREEIAATLGKTREAIRRNLCDARTRLAGELYRDGEHRQPPRTPARTTREEAR